jgi:hypothetical protein
MPHGARPPALDASKKREILAILTMGCSRRAAAKYVGCAPATIGNTASRDAEFAAQLGQAESKAEVGYMKNIREAANKEQYWRAAAWALERKYPADYALRGPDVITRAEILNMIAQLIEVIVAEIESPKVRKVVVKRLQSLASALTKSRKGWVAQDETSP